MPAVRPLRLLLAFLLALLVLAPIALLPYQAAAASLTFTVTSTADARDANPGDGVCADTAGQCTLRAAIQEADAQPAGSSITITVPAGTYGLPLGTLELTANRITISGVLSSTTILSGTNTSSVMAISHSVQATISQVTLTGGNARTGSGGGLLNEGRTILAQVIVTNNTARRYGGGIYNSGGGRLTVVGSILSANSAPNARVGKGGGIYNEGGEVSVTDSALSANSTTYDGGGIDNEGGTVSVIDSALSANLVTYNGGGIANSGMLSVSHSILSGNSASRGGIGGGEGGGIENTGTLSVTSSSIVSNTAIYYGNGGGIANFGTLSVVNSTISANAAVSSCGGGIYNTGGTLTVTDSTISANVAAVNGGGIHNEAMARVTNSTISANSAPSGGSIFNYGSDRPTVMALSYATVAANSSGIDNVSSTYPATIKLAGTIVANTTSGPNCTGPTTESQGYNLDSDGTCGLTLATDISNVDPLLGPLADNGGSTETIALLAGSPAIDHGGVRANGCPQTDQRGLPRPDEATDGGACDIGAYESQGIG